MNRGITSYSLSETKKIIHCPTTDTLLLKKRQSYIREFLEKPKLSKNSEKLLTNIKSLETPIAWFLKEHDDETISYFDQVYFENRLLLTGNASSYGLSGLYYLFTLIYPYMNIIYPLGILLLPWKTLTRLNMKKTFKNLCTITIMLVKSMFSNYKAIVLIALSSMMYAYTSYNTIQTTYQHHKVVCEIHEKIKKLSDFVVNAHTLLYQPESSYYNSNIRASFVLLDELIINKDIVDATVINPSSIESNGKILVIFKRFLTDPKYKESLQKIISEVGRMDHIYAMSILYKRYQYNFPTYVYNDKPIVRCENIWNPSIIHNVDNSITMEKNIIITGPNMGGKSTFIKNILINILLSQTVGLCNSDVFEFTPFSLIHTHINIPDLTGKESLFEAEIHRVMDYIKNAENLNKNEFGFSVFDEILTSTNIVEGTSVAKSICDEFALNKNTLNIITTHFDDLIDSEHFEHYQVLIERFENEIIFLYKIGRGVSKEKIAIELLKTKGFNSRIIDGALKYKQVAEHKIHKD